MKKYTLFMVAAVLSSSIFSSCTKFYNCECTDHQGTVTKYTVDARSKIQANKKCDDKGELSNCELK